MSTSPNLPSIQPVLILQIQLVLDRFEASTETIDVQTGMMDTAMSSSTATAAPQDQIEELMNRVNLPIPLAHVLLDAADIIGGG